MTSTEAKPFAVLLDVMGTLVHDPFDLEIPRFFGLSQAELRREQLPGLWERFERGEIDESQYLDHYFQDGRAIDRGAFREVVRSAYRWLDGAEAILADLRGRGYELHALSNYPVWYLVIEEQLHLSRYLSWSFVSCRTRVRKPDPAAFRGAALALDRPPQGCLFVDDREVNCRAAEAVGMQAVHCEGARGLRTELRRLSFL